MWNDKELFRMSRNDIDKKKHVLRKCVGGGTLFRGGNTLKVSLGTPAITQCASGCSTYRIHPFQATPFDHLNSLWHPRDGYILDHLSQGRRCLDALLRMDFGSAPSLGLSWSPEWPAACFGESRSDMKLRGCDAFAFFASCDYSIPGIRRSDMTHSLRRTWKLPENLCKRR